MIFLAKLIPTKTSLEAPPPPLAKFLGWGGSPFWYLLGASGPKTQDPVCSGPGGPVRSESSLQKDCGLRSKRQGEIQLAQVYILPSKQQGKTIKLSCLMIEITLKVVEMP